jgi:hypothetical protein
MAIDEVLQAVGPNPGEHVVLRRMALTGADQIFMAACRHAYVAGDPEGLKTYLALHLDALSDASEGWRDRPDGLNGTTLGPAAHAASVLAGLVRAMCTGEDAGGAVERALVHVDAAHVVIGRADNDVPTELGVGGTPGLRHVLSHLDLQHHDGRGAVALLALQIADLLPRYGRHTVRLPVLFQRGDQHGEVGELRLARLDCPQTGLFPDPRTMAFFSADAEFGDALATAWEGSPLADADKDAAVTWSITEGSGPVLRVDGGSLGGALAVGLAELDRRRAPLRVKRLDQRCAVSAALGSDGALARVEHVAQKLDAAADRKPALRHVVLPEANRGDTAAENPPVKVRFAATVKDATSAARRGNRGLLAAVAGAAAVTALFGGLFLSQRAESQHRTEVAAKRRTADRLERLADGTGDRSVGDLSLQALLLLAAADLTREAGDPAAADELLRSAIVVPSGAVERLDADVDGVDRLDYLGPGMLVSSDSGQLAYIDAFGDVVSRHTEGPGIASLAQPRLRAVARLPQLDVFATVMHAGDDDPQELVILASPPEAHSPDAEPMEELARIEIEGAPVRALAYEDGGGRLISASVDRVTQWSVAYPTPSPSWTCELGTGAAPEGTPEPTAAVVDPSSGAPLILFDDGRLLRVEDAWGSRSAQPDAPPCAMTEILAAVGTDTIAATTTTEPPDDAAAPPEVLVATAVPSGGEVLVRSSGPRPPATVRLGEGPPVTALALRSDGRAVAVARSGEGDDRVVEVHDLTTGGQLATFAGHDGPLAYTPDGLVATERGGRVLDVLVDAAWVTPRGAVAEHAAQAVATGRESFATTRTGSAIGVFHLDRRRPGSYVTFPEGWVSPSNGAFGRLFDVDDGGTLLASALMREDEPRSARVSLWDVATGREIALPYVPAIRRERVNDPIGVRFVDGEDAFVVAYRRGDIVRYARDGSRWRATPLWEGGATRAVWGMELVRDRLTVLTFEPNVGGDDWFQEVVSLSPVDGTVRNRWDVRPLGLDLGPPDGESRLAFTVPLSGGDVLLVETGGTVYRLEADGGHDGPLGLDEDLVVTGAEVSAADGIVALGGRQGVVAIDVDGALRRAHDRYGPMASVGVTSDGRYLVGSEYLAGRTAVIPLEASDQRADLCLTAGRELTRREWSAYVGEVTGYRELCADVNTAQEGLSHAVREMQQAQPAALLHSATTDQARSLRPFCDPGVRSPAVVASRHGDLSWATATHGELAPGVTATVCAAGELRWVLPSSGPNGDATDPSQLSILAGEDDDGEPIVALLLRTVPQDGGGYSLWIDVVGTDGFVTSVQAPRANVFADLGGRLIVRSMVDDIVVDATFGPVPDTSRWALTRAVPDGDAPPAGSVVADVATTLPGPSLALEAVPFTGSEWRVIAVLGDERPLVVVGDAQGPSGTAELVRSEDDPAGYELVAWREDNRLVCGDRGAGRPDMPVLTAEMRAAARCDIAADDLVLTNRGLGPLRLGMSVDEALATGVARFEGAPVDGPRRCARASTRFPLAGADLRFDDGRLVGISVVSPVLPTVDGLRVGSSRDDVEDVLGDPEGDETVSVRYASGSSRVREVVIGEPELLCVPEV